MPRYVTLDEVATRAGVHPTAVSLAIRGRPGVSDQTRARILSIARELRYTPAPFVRALATYRRGRAAQFRTSTLAYLTNWHTRWGWKGVPAHRKFFSGAEAKASELGFGLRHFWLHERGRTSAKLTAALRAEGIDGLIVASYSREMGDELNLDWGSFSAVKIDYFPHQPPLHNVTNSQLHIARLAVRKAAAAGYRRIGFVYHRGWNHAVDQNWTAGFLAEQALLVEGEWIPPHIFPEKHPKARWFNETNPSVTADLEPLRQWLNRYRPDVVIAKSDYVLPVFEKLRLKIPRDLAFVDVHLEKPDGRLAGVRQNHETVGALAVEILVGQLHHNKFGVPATPTTTFVEGTWFDGASCPRLT
jgi:LacI family transcriptional regulator